MGGDGQTTNCNTKIWFTGPVSTTSSAPFTTVSTSDSGVINGAGWIPVNLETVAEIGLPLSNYPLDPLNLGREDLSSSRYGYVCRNSPPQFTLFANMESEFYKTLGRGDVESRDGGKATSVYEVGTTMEIATTMAQFNAWYPNH